MKLRNYIGNNILLPGNNMYFIADYQDPVLKRAVGIFKSSYTGSSYMSDSGRVCGYETFADPYYIEFHV